MLTGSMRSGSDNRFGRLIDDLGDRNFLQLSTDPGFRIGGRDVIAEQLGISDQCDTHFAWNTIARRDPDHGRLPCPDCEEYRGHRFISAASGCPMRIKEGRTTQVAAKPDVLSHSDEPQETI